MNATLKSLLTPILFLFSLSQLFPQGVGDNATQQATVLFDLEECLSIIPGETSRDYSEFTGVVSPQPFADISVVGGHLFRNDALANPHSCTPGVFDGTQGMCVLSLIHI